jgi:hypothetical protein
MTSRAFLRGRLTQKLYSNLTSGVRSDYLHYDWLDRPTCDAITSGSCPGGGSNLKTSATYNASNDRSTFRSTRYGDLHYAEDDKGQLCASREVAPTAFAFTTCAY